VLVYSLSVLDQVWRLSLLVLMLVLGLGALYYAMAVIRSQFPQTTPP